MKHHLHTKGAVAGHLLRRLIHLGLVLIPIIYFFANHWLQQHFKISSAQVLAYLVVLVACFECVRLRFGWVIVGQREYEKQQASAVFWGMLGIYLVIMVCTTVLTSPVPVVLAITISLALVDPVAGECRAYQVPGTVYHVIVSLLILVIWLAALYFSPYPLWLSILMVPTTIFAERIRLPNIDDNFTLCLFPLLLCMLVLTGWH